MIILTLVRLYTLNASLNFNLFLLIKHQYYTLNRFFNDSHGALDINTQKKLNDFWQKWKFKNHVFWQVNFTTQICETHNFLFYKGKDNNVEREKVCFWNSLKKITYFQIITKKIRLQHKAGNNLFPKRESKLDTRGAYLFLTILLWEGKKIRKNQTKIHLLEWGITTIVSNTNYTYIYIYIYKYMSMCVFIYIMKNQLI